MDALDATIEISWLLLSLKQTHGPLVSLKDRSKPCIHCERARQRTELFALRRTAGRKKPLRIDAANRIFFVPEPALEEESR
jgi:hypothetical protein